MKTGIIGLPQVGKTSLFRILTGARVEGRSTPNQAHIGIAKVPDARVLKLADADFRQADVLDLALCL